MEFAPRSARGQMNDGTGFRAGRNAAGSAHHIGTVIADLCVDAVEGLILGNGLDRTSRAACVACGTFIRDLECHNATFG